MVVPLFRESNGKVTAMWACLTCFALPSDRAGGTRGMTPKRAVWADLPKIFHAVLQLIPSSRRE